MSDTRKEIASLEEDLRRAELGPDPAFFERVLADDAVIVSERGAGFAKKQIVEAHRPGAGPKFTRVEMSGLRIVDHGPAAVVTCRGAYETSKGAFSLSFMRVWVRKPEGWRIVAGSVTEKS